MTRTLTVAWAAAGFALLAAAAGRADTPTVPLTYDDARAIVLQRSPHIAAAAALATSRDELAKAIRTLRLPLVTLDASAAHYGKTLFASTGDIESAFQNVIGGISNLLPAGTSIPLPAISLPQQEFALPVSQIVTAGSLVGVLPIFDAGRIGAIQNIARTSAQQGQIDLANVREDQETLLVTRYFGLAAATVAARAADAGVDDLNEHLRDARAAQRSGVSTRLLTLQTQAALDAVRSVAVRAHRSVDVARASLQALLGAGQPIAPATPLFVITNGGLEPQEAFLGLGQSGSSAVLAAVSSQATAKANERLARSAYYPQIFGVAQYTINPRGASVLQPDYLVGVAAQLTLVSPIDRARTIAAAAAASRAATAAAGAAQSDAERAVREAYANTLDARDAYVFDGSAVAAALEDVRAANERLRAGRAVPTAVGDSARLLLDAQAKRTADAYAYDVALAALLRIVGRSDAFGEYIARADVVIR